MNHDETARPTSVQNVTFFEDRARVHRVVECELQPGLHNIKLSGISVLIADDTLQTGVGDGARVVTASVRRVMEQRENASPSEIAELEEKVQTLAFDVDDAKRSLKRASAAAERSSGIETTLLTQVYEARDGLGDDVQELAATFGSIDHAITQGLADRAHWVQTRDERAKKHDQAKLALTNARLKHPEISTHIEVQVDVESAGTYSIDLRYFVPCALWRPAHIAKLLRDGDSSQIYWESIATVWQRTGEVWENISCEFSTARPGSAASAPVLFDDVLRTQPRADKTVHVEAREVEISAAGHEGGALSSEMPGVDDGGEPLVLRSDTAVSIPSNGRPFRVKIGEHKLPCKISKVVTPLLSPVPHIRAEASWTGELPILAGPVSVMRAGAFVGRADIGFIPPSEGFEIGFGVDSDVTVRYVVEDDHDSTLTGRNILTRTTHLFLNNLSNAPNRVHVRVRIPVSEIEDVKVKTDFGTQEKSSGFTVKEGGIDKDGFADLAFDLEPNCTGEYTFDVQVDSGRKVNLVF